MRRIVPAIKRRIRILQTPFADKQAKKLLIHCCYHKVGTVWFTNILREIAHEYRLHFQSCKQNELQPNTDIFLQYVSRVDLSTLPKYKSSHIIRDPRDIIISAYFYHLWTNETKSWRNQT